ncbi:hypothetical protein [Haloarchaeobius iranensis]|uniref:DUF8135 domain-containing protein n=1 Tax=Haloarchaeobius iranensis TaxID=996166 RepID=A0A1G9X2M5_9EURY|nr:hypothetical protein [Haloarchaeobius iranensis]SDM90635.1 hypothetical protein SAMN05192554_109104 [Haloarchaeobius iranensis]
MTDDDPLDDLVDEMGDTQSVPPDEAASDDGEAAETADETTQGEADTAPSESGGPDGDAPNLRDVSHEVTGPDGESPPELEGETAGPLGEMADEFERRREDRDAEPDDDLFESVDVGDVDSEALWEQVSTDESTAEPEPDVPEVRVISKSKYCQRCEYFTDPPAVGCTNEGTTIKSEASMDEFEVVDCPKILEDERLERTR